MPDFATVDELKAHYHALKKRTGGLSGPTGVISPQRQSLPVRGFVDPHDKMLQIETPRHRFVKLLKEVARQHHLDPEMVKEPTLQRDVVKVRQEFFYRAYNEMHLTQEQIGRLSGVAHTTVSRGIKAHEKTLESKFI